MLQVVHFNTQTRTFFFEDDWLNDQRRRVQIAPGKVGENNVYRVSFGLKVFKLPLYSSHMLSFANALHGGARRVFFGLVVGPCDF